MKTYHKKVLDGLWSKIVRTLAGFKCQRCGAQHKSNSKGLHAHHIATKGSHGFSTRWLIDNGAAVCYGCHMYLQTHPEENRRFCIEELGRNYDEITALGKTTVKVFYEDKKAELQEIYEDACVGLEIREDLEE